MGFNKLIFCLNDDQHEIDDDPIGFWNACRQAFSRLRGTPLSFGYGSQAVHEGHADEIVVVIAGNNYTTIVGNTCRRGGGWPGHHTEEGQIEILKEVLRRKGYIISKKPVAKPRNR